MEWKAYTRSKYGPCIFKATFWHRLGGSHWIYGNGMVCRSFPPGKIRFVTLIDLSVFLVGRKMFCSYFKEETSVRSMGRLAAVAIFPSFLPSKKNVSGEKIMAWCTFFLFLEAT